MDVFAAISLVEFESEGRFVLHQEFFNAVMNTVVVLDLASQYGSDLVNL